MKGLPDLLEEHGTEVLTPEGTAGAIRKDLERSPALQRYAVELVKRARFNAILHASRRLELAVANASVERTPIEGLGQPVMCISQDDMRMMCQKYGPAWFRDKEMREDTLKRHPELRPRVRARRLTVSVSSDEWRVTSDEKKRLAARNSSLVTHHSSLFSGGRRGAQGDSATASAFGNTAHELPVTQSDQARGLRDLSGGTPELRPEQAGRLCYGSEGGR